MNIRRIKTLRNFIAKLPEKAIHMPDWIKCDRDGETVEEAARHTCGTRACIAGWAILKFHRARRAVIRDGGMDVQIGKSQRHPSDIAAQILGLTYDESDDLFMGRWTTIVPMSKHDITKRDVLRELDHIIKTGEV